MTVEGWGRRQQMSSVAGRLPAVTRDAIEKLSDADSLEVEEGEGAVPGGDFGIAIGDDSNAICRVDFASWLRLPPTRRFEDFALSMDMPPKPQRRAKS